MLFKINIQGLKRFVNNFNIKKEILHFTSLSIQKSQILMSEIIKHLLNYKDIRRKHITNTFLIF